MFRYLINQTIHDDVIHRVYVLDSKILSCSCHKDLAINPDATWHYKLIINGVPTEGHATMQELEVKLMTDAKG